MEIIQIISVVLKFEDGFIVHLVALVWFPCLMTYQPVEGLISLICAMRCFCISTKDCFVQLWIIHLIVLISLFFFILGLDVVLLGCLLLLFWSVCLDGLMLANVV